MDGALQALTLVAALGCGLVAGFLFAFSSAVMDALRRLPPPEGVAAMQSINVMVVRPPFMLAMFGTAAACIALVVAAVSNWSEPFGPWLLAGSLLYLAGPIGLTVVYNVPRNNALAAADPGTPKAAAVWERYLREWTTANHVRTAMGLAAAAALTVALYVD